MILEKKLILSFDDIRASDLIHVGGKGANLGEMTHAGFPVPSGFCVSTDAFRQFVASYPEMDDLYTLLDGVAADDLEAARSIGHQVREALMSVPMPEHIAAEIKQQWEEIGTDNAYAVRSSATAEDLPDASFAGQQDTYLNILGIDALLDAVRRCWVSLFTDRAILYRGQNGFSHRNVYLSVVVQQMIMSEKSGILFTSDPLTGHRKTLVIDASFGLGEALVSGLVTPDLYRVDKDTKNIIEREVAEKTLAIFPELDGGTRQETLNGAQRTETVLSDEQILDLLSLGLRVEAHYNKPQDIEWAIADGQVYLLQTRPITALYPIDGLKSPDDSLHIYFGMSHQQNMTNALSPLGISNLRTLFPFKQSKGDIESIIVRTSGGRLFLDLTQALRHPIFRRVAFAGMAQFNMLGPDAVKIAMQRPAFKHASKISFSPSFLRTALSNVAKIVHVLWFKDVTGFVRIPNQIIADNLEAIRTKIDQAQEGKQKVQTIIDILHSLFPIIFDWIPEFIAGEAAKRLLARIGEGWASADDIDAVELGLQGNVVTDMNLALGDLADIARRSEQVMALFAELGNDSKACLSKASALGDNDEFMQAWQAFLEQYGARGSAEIDLRTPRWYEEPLPLLQVIASYLQREEGHHRKQHQNLVDKRHAAAKRLIDGANHGIFGWIRTRMVRRLIHVIAECGNLREHHKYFAVQVFRIVKEALKGTAQWLVERDKLSKADDIWFLSWAELQELVSKEDFDVHELITQRQKDLDRFQKLSPPMVITSDGEIPVVRHTLADAPENALVGNPVSAGVVEGVIRVIRDPQTETLKPGEILVAPFTDPGWTPLFINAGALIMEVGGTMTHGSVVAREYGIPAIVGVHDATRILITGQKVRVDGNRGIIELL